MKAPKLRFKADDGNEFPEWTKVSFGSLIREYVDKTKETVERCVLSCAIEGVFLNSELFGHQRGESNVGYKKIQNNTLILSTQNLHLGNANVNRRFIHGIISPAYKTYHVVGCLPEFMAIWVKRPAAKRFFYEATTVGASQCRRNVVWDELYAQTLSLPSFPEQQKIASFLSTIDEIIQSTESELTAWQERKKGVMQKIFNREVRFKADDGSEFPEWEEKRLGEVCEYGKRHGTGQNYVGTENMFSAFGGVIIENTESECNGILYSSGDILMSNIRPYLKKVWLADREGVCSTDVLVFRPIKIESEYLYCLIASDFFITKVMSAAKGSKMPRGDKKHIMEIPVSVPSLPEQRKIADCLSSLDDVINQIKAELSAWKEFKKGLLQQMFV